MSITIGSLMLQPGRPVLGAVALTCTEFFAKSRSLANDVVIDWLRREPLLRLRITNAGCFEVLPRDLAIELARDGLADLFHLGLAVGALVAFVKVVK